MTSAATLTEEENVFMCGVVRRTKWYNVVDRLVLVYDRIDNLIQLVLHETLST